MPKPDSTLPTSWSSAAARTGRVARSPSEASTRRATPAAWRRSARRMRRQRTTSSGSSWDSAHSLSVDEGPLGIAVSNVRLTRWAAEAISGWASFGVVDAEPRGRHRFEAGLVDLVPADLAGAVAAVVELGQGALDVVELVAQ